MGEFRKELVPDTKPGELRYLVQEIVTHDGVRLRGRIPRRIAMFRYEKDRDEYIEFVNGAPDVAVRLAGEAKEVEQSLRTHIRKLESEVNMWRAECDNQREAHNFRVEEMTVSHNKRVGRLNALIASLEEEVRDLKGYPVQTRPMSYLHEHQTAAGHTYDPRFAAFTHSHTGGDKSHGHATRYAGTIEEE